MDYTVYTGGFPWLKWSRHFTEETSVRVKLIESYNLLSTVLTVALWSGNDDYETTKKCGHAVYKQLKELKTIQHPLTGQEIKIIRRMCGDGKERRLSTGNSSTKSTYSIPEAPEPTGRHEDYLSRTSLDSLRCRALPGKNLRLNCVEKPPPKKSTQFAKQNLGNSGLKNLNGTPLSEYYPGTAHLGFWLAEMLCLRIAKIAAGKMCLFKLVYTDSDCVARENINILPILGRFKPTKAPKKFSLVLLSLTQWR